jgi:hypothetical protein
MVYPIITILILLGVLAVTVVLFGGWLIGIIARGAWRWINQSPYRNNFSADRACGNPGCRMLNPPHARFCRRCGAGLGREMNVANRGLKIDDRGSKIEDRGSKIASTM